MGALIRACRSVDPEAADLIEFIAYTGQRPVNVRDTEWKRYDRTNGLLHITQDGLRPPVDVSPEAKGLLERLRGGRENPTGPIVKISDRIQKRALSLLKRCVTHLLPEHPDLVDMTDLKALRHYFASVCVMAGVDFATVALWLGHTDGGILVAKTYGHLRRDHTRKAMEGMRFTAPPAPSPANSTSPTVG